MIKAEKTSIKIRGGADALMGELAGILASEPLLDNFRVFVLTKKEELELIKSIKGLEDFVRKVEIKSKDLEEGKFAMLGNKAEQETKTVIEIAEIIIDCMEKVIEKGKNLC